MPRDPGPPTSPNPGLSQRARAIMQMIADGHSYEQILAAYPHFTYRDIFDSAAEVLKAADRVPSDRMQVLKKRHRRAYEAWTDDEEQQLRKLIADGHTVARIAGRLERNRGAIRSRIVRLGLVEQLDPNERARLQRIMELRKLGDG